jgi:hypothetical protein
MFLNNGTIIETNANEVKLTVSNKCELKAV